MNVPHDLAAEEAVLGACMLSVEAIAEASELLLPADFYKPLHQRVFHAILDVSRQGRVDPITVHAEYAGIPVEELHRLMVNTPTISNVPLYCATITRTRVARAIIFAASEMTKRAATGDDDALDRAKALLEEIAEPITVGRADENAGTFLTLIDMHYDWLFPNFLERGDRLIVTAGEGVGKSTLLLQIAVQAAEGIHPWTWQACAPIRTTYIDCENSPRKTARQAKTMLRDRKTAPTMLTILHRQGGVNIGGRKDRTWLRECVERNEAELLIIGPLYKIMEGIPEKGDIGGEDFTRSITHVIDSIRHRCGIAFISEAHSPHGGPTGRELRPAGSSVWMRWPDFGIGLRQNRQRSQQYAIEHWRAPRDVRTWPTDLVQGGRSWPWEPLMGDGTFNGTQYSATF